MLKSPLRNRDTHGQIYPQQRARRRAGVDSIFNRWVARWCDRVLPCPAARSCECLLRRTNGCWRRSGERTEPWGLTLDRAARSPRLRSAVEFGFGLAAGSRFLELSPLNTRTQQDRGAYLSRVVLTTHEATRDACLAYARTTRLLTCTSSAHSAARPVHLAANSHLHRHCSQRGPILQGARRQIIHAYSELRTIV